MKKSGFLLVFIAVAFVAQSELRESGLLDGQEVFFDQSMEPDGFPTSAIQGIDEFSLAEVLRMLSREDGVLVDTRSFPEFEGGRIPTAIHLDVLNEAEMIDLVERSKRTRSRLIVYCKDSGCGNSWDVARRLQKLGAPKVGYYKNGFAEWLFAGLEVER